MLRQAIEFTCGIAQDNLVNRGVDSLFDSLSGKDDSHSDLEHMESNFNSLMARAADIEKEIRVKVEQGCRKRKKEVEVWFEDVKKVEGEYRAYEEEGARKGFIKKIFGGDEAIKLNTRICYLDKRSRLFGEFVVVDNRNTGLPRPTTELEGAAFHDNVERIWNLLENDQVSSIGVHGMGGVGKSTLVEHIHNQLLERNKCVFWVVVSFQRCSIKMLQDKIAHAVAHAVDLKFSDKDDEGARAGKLYHVLSQRGNFLLIFDDVWERIDLVKVGLPLSVKGCKWMMTSRSLKVCREMKCQENIAIKPLGKDEGWNLFLKNLGHDSTSTLRDGEVEGIAKRMVEICDGLPLGIITLAGAVSGVTDIQEWRHELGVLEESVMGHEWMEEKVFMVLKYSFDRLSLNDQCCFLYCSLYPEDYEISKVQLFRKFITEKLVDEKKSRTAQHDEAHSIVSRLVKVSLLESVDRDSAVKMHDLVRAMAHEITKGKSMVIAGKDSQCEIPMEEEWTKDLEKVSLMCNSIEEIPHGISPNCPKLTTLLLQQNNCNRIATSFFSQMCGLHTLDLSFTGIEVLPDSVSELVNLTSLLLEGCLKLVHVPCVRKLKELRELDLSGTAIKDVPQGMEELLNIRFLSMNAASNLSRTTLEFKSPRLQHLHLPVHIEAKLVGGGERLEVFVGSLEHVSDFNRMVASKKGSISYLMVVGDSGKIFEDDFLFYVDDTRELYVCEYDFKEENELSTILGDYIKHLEVKSCEGMSKCLLDDFTNPSSLNKLTISNCGGIECILTYDQFKASQQPQFHALEKMKLCNLDDFMGVFEIEGVAPRDLPPPIFSSLRDLSIHGCNKMKKLGLPLSVFEKLEFITVECCEEMEVIIQVGAADLPNLKWLRLAALPSLGSFCDAPLICNSLDNFLLEDCPGLQLPFLYWGTPHSYNPLSPGFGVEQIRTHSS